MVRISGIGGAGSKLSEQAFVYPPPEYFQPSYAHSRFPVIEVLSDYPGTEARMLHELNYRTVLRALNNLSGRLRHLPAPPMSVVAVYRPGGADVRSRRTGHPSELAWLSAKLAKVVALR